MNKIVALGANDLKNIFRDKTLTLIFFTPFIIILLLRFAVPELAERFPIIVGYFPPIIAFFCYMLASFPAFLVSFIMLEEKDEEVLTVISVMPFSLKRFVAYRMVLILLVGTLLSAFAMVGSRLVHAGYILTFGISFLFALIGPLTTLTVVTFAKNKIEGLSILKGLSLILMLPLLSFFSHSSWKLVLAIIPVFWTYMAFGELTVNLRFAFYFSIGLAVHILYLAVLFRRVGRKL